MKSSEIPRLSSTRLSNTRLSRSGELNEKKQGNRKKKKDARQLLCNSYCSFDCSFDRLTVEKFDVSSARETRERAMFSTRFVLVITRI